jgi:hypothetical protein
MRAPGVWVIVGSCVVLLGLSAASPRAPAAAPRQDAPAALLATVAIGPATTLRGLAAYLDAVSPGASAGLSDQALRRELARAVGVPSLDGVDPASWMYLLVVSAAGRPPMLALLAKVGDAKTVMDSVGGSARIQNGWAVIGDKPVIDRVGTYALTTLAAQPAPSAPGATLYMPHVLARYRTEIDGARKEVAAQSAQAPGDQMTRMMGPFVDGVIGALGEIDQVVVTLEASPDLMALDLAVAPRPNSRLAGFVGIQRPSDYALLDKLPAAAAPTLVIAGHLEGGPYRSGMSELTAVMFGAKEMKAGTEALFKATTGEIAATFRLSPGSGMSAAQLLGVSDMAAANRAFAVWLDGLKPGRTFGPPQMATTIRALPDAPVHDGVTLRGYRTSFDLSKTPPEQRKAMERMVGANGGAETWMAAFDGVGTIVGGPDSSTVAGQVIDAVRGKAPRFVTPPAVAQFLAESRARKDSLAMTLEMAGIVAAATGAAPRGGGDAPMRFSLGFADRRAHLRIAVPVASIRTMMPARRP